MREPTYSLNEEIPGTQYRFLEVLGAGGHGVVWRVEHTFLDTPAVMKVIHADLSTDEAHIRRAIAEAKLLAKLEHPNLVPASNGGLTAERPRRAYFVMPHLRGMTLHDVMTRLPQGLGLKEALEIAIGVLDGLDCAHAEHGVIHRDIKPANIFLNQTATGQTVPKILDWGIAHFCQAPLHITGDRFLGTPRYASPEQLRGEQPTAKTDLYAVGLVLHEMLSGRHPFWDRGNVGALIQAHLFEAARPIDELYGAVPDKLARLVASMLEKAPDRRPSSAAATAAALRRVLNETALERAGELHRSRGHLTDPSPMRNLMITTTAGPSITPASQPPEALPSRTQPIHDTAPGAPPFPDVIADDTPARSPALAPTEPSPRPPLGWPARGAIDRLAITREARASLREAPLPRNDTEPMLELRRDVPFSGPLRHDTNEAAVIDALGATPRRSFRIVSLARYPVPISIAASAVVVACVLTLWRSLLAAAPPPTSPSPPLEASAQSPAARATPAAPMVPPTVATAATAPLAMATTAPLATAATAPLAMATTAPLAPSRPASSETKPPRRASDLPSRESAGPTGAPIVRRDHVTAPASSDAGAPRRSEFFDDVDFDGRTIRPEPHRPSPASSAPPPAPKSDFIRTL